MKLSKDFLEYELRDDNKIFGGISYVGETLQNFIEEVRMNETDSMEDVNEALKKCGIEQIEY